MLRLSLMTAFACVGRSFARLAHTTTDSLTVQFQTHWENGTMYLCHTSCELLNAGTLEDYLTAVTRWLRAHPYDVITVLMGNSDVVDAGNFTAPVVNSGLIDF